MNSSDWCANEKECNDSEGNRLRSSVKLRTGEDGPEGMPIEDSREFDNVRVMEPERGATNEALREDSVDSEVGRVGARRGCCRIRRKPEAPRPCSCSVIIGDLEESLSQSTRLDISTDIRDTESLVTRELVSFAVQKSDAAD